LSLIESNLYLPIPPADMLFSALFVDECNLQRQLIKMFVCIIAKDSTSNRFHNSS